MDLVGLERRKEERVSLKEKPIFVNIPLSYPSGHSITKPVIDMSGSGLAFELSDTEGYFLPGTRFQNVKIINAKYEKRIFGAVVRYHQKIKKGNQTACRIGLEFLIKPFEKSLLRRKLLSRYGVRMPRISTESLTGLNWELRFGEAGRTLTKVLNFSKGGVEFCVDENLNAFQSGELIDGVSITVNGETLYQGTVKVLGLKNQGDKTSVNCSLENGELDTGKILVLARGDSIRRQIETHLHESDSEKAIDPEFKCEVNDLRDFLQNLKISLDEEDGRLKMGNTRLSGEERKHYESVLLRNASEASFSRLDRAFASIQKLVKNLSPQRDKLHKAYFRKHLHELLLASPFNRRAFEKPLGYAGDYEMMEMIYRDADEGETLFAKLMNRYILGKTAPRAVRSRVCYITQRLSSLLKERFSEKEIIHVMNVGSGSARELQSLIAENPLLDRCHIMLLDADLNSLLQVQETLRRLLKEHQRSTKVQYVHKAVDQIIKEVDWRENVGKQEIIYCTGLFDYLPHKVASELIKSLYEMLNRDGILIIANLNDNNDTKNFMEYVGEWYVIHRDDEELLALAEAVEEAKAVSIEVDETKSCSFLIIEKA